MVPLITRETSYGQHVNEWIFRVNIFDLDFTFKIDYVKWSIKSDSEISTHVSSWDFVL